MNTKKSNTSEAIDKAIDLTEKTALTTLKTAVKSAEVAEGYIQGMYKAGHDANVDIMKVAKNYWEVTSEIRQDWINLFAFSGEKFIRAAANIELPMQKEVSNFGKGIFANLEQSFENFTKEAKSGVK